MNRRKIAVVVAASTLVPAIAYVAIAAVGSGASTRAEDVVADDFSCEIENSLPDSGTIELTYVKPSSNQDPDKNDYRLSGTLVWNSNEALACYSHGRVDYAYEHEIRYAPEFDRKIWNENFQNIGEAGAHGYIDNTLLDNDLSGDEEATTTLSIGIFRPERLSAGVVYRFNYELMLPKSPPSGKHTIFVGGEIPQKSCSVQGPNCVGLNPGAHRPNAPFVGRDRGFSVTGTTCWAWSRGQDPVRCDVPAPTTQPAPATTAAPAPATTAAPAPATTAAPAPPSEPRSELATSSLPPSADGPPAPPAAAPPVALSLRTERSFAANENCYGEPYGSIEVFLEGTAPGPVHVVIQHPPGYAEHYPVHDGDMVAESPHVYGGSFGIFSVCVTPGSPFADYTVVVTSAANDSQVWFEGTFQAS